ncbi:hypothetical protein JZ751_014259 [Albula glossodonta]|uniref:Uncharacterized protein n=1 Tax=Albula glossodonta TaxID=121402 RepID=A0A8T2P0V8_9TELE|nr:hypothetical protein JZ751_014259 [Albula glossodonta]
MKVLSLSSISRPWLSSSRALARESKESGSLVTGGCGFEEKRAHAEPGLAAFGEEGHKHSVLSEDSHPNALVEGQEERSEGRRCVQVALPLDWKRAWMGGSVVWSSCTMQTISALLPPVVMSMASWPEGYL